MEIISLDSAWHLLYNIFTQVIYIFNGNNIKIQEIESLIMPETLEHFLHEVVLHSVLDTLKLVPFLFITYLIMELIEHKASDKVGAFMKKSGALGPVIGGAIGAVPQCGFSASASNLYTGRIITAGTLVAVFLSTSDEMLPILISNALSPKTIAAILISKVLIGVLVGFGIDLALRLSRCEQEQINIDEFCENNNCHCEEGILRSALRHTLNISLFVLLATFLLSLLIFLVGEDAIASVMQGYPVISHIISAAVGLIPNCAASVVITTLYVDGFISVGTMMAGLLSGSGVGLLVLFRVNRGKLRENLLILLSVFLSGIIFGLLSDLILPLIIG